MKWPRESGGLPPPKHPSLYFTDVQHSREGTEWPLSFSWRTIGKGNRRVWWIRCELSVNYQRCYFLQTTSLTAVSDCYSSGTADTLFAVKADLLVITYTQSFAHCTEVFDSNAVMEEKCFLTTLQSCQLQCLVCVSFTGIKSQLVI